MADYYYRMLLLIQQTLLAYTRMLDVLQMTVMATLPMIYKMLLHFPFVAYIN